MGSLTGKVAVITGASRGIGKGIALVLAEQGATVYVTGRTVNPGDYYLPGTVGETAAECTERGKAEGGKGIAVACDHGDDIAVAALFERVKAEQGRLDILVNNAFTLSDDLLEPKGFWDKPLSNLEMWDVGVRSNYVAAWHAAQIMVPQKSGLIVAISGFAAVTYTYGTIFGTSKSAVDRMARDMAIELEPHGVASLTLWQGLTLTEKAKDNLAKMGDKMTKSITSMTGSTVEHPGR
ncbi:MAG TPA: SDR family NAD(P)-dependent oxidoreductase, partial [Sphingobium sp.]